MSVIDPEDRYSRQVRFDPLGHEGQERLMGGRVVVIGCGALGSGIAHNLVRAGVGMIRIVDRDTLDPSNLARQVLFREDDVHNRLPKVFAAARMLHEINSDICIEPIHEEVTRRNVLSLISGVDVVLDGSDNVDLRFLLNDACVSTGTPWVFGGAVAASGMSMTICPDAGPCLRCVFEEKPGPGAVKTCNDLGVLNTLTAMVSAVQSTEAIKLLTGRGTPNTDLLSFDIWELSFHKSHVQRRADCPTCGLKRFDFLAGDSGD